MTLEAIRQLEARERNETDPDSLPLSAIRFDAIQIEFRAVPLRVDNEALDPIEFLCQKTATH